MKMAARWGATFDFLGAKRCLRAPPNGSPPVRISDGNAQVGGLAG